MSEEQEYRSGNPEDAEPGKGAGGDQFGVQMAQNPAVNPADEEIPSNVDVARNIKNLDAAVEQEENTDLKTTDGYVIDESGRIDNFAIEPPMYVQE
ncbi:MULTISPECIES: hypothetical protein [Trichocoleus]|uniref:Uncharacterized protein n=1 Tax=Trichocoleus desertorum GB2-A4 TaxID=2933944 RepID=A0ABV0J3D6_9CYAN|nr:MULTISPECIES: hypothetical protein [unclassified Trichocoleus]MBD1861616.1 hypothetical protein [Trichocoleus sp. FACHB-46]MBD2098522.1 hypothetical protein [Trichocoleus sp. FACHB-591]MBD2124109.1 hypothetical protein [Trichocoleus sp. FACHB-262]